MVRVPICMASEEVGYTGNLVGLCDAVEQELTTSISARKGD